MCNMLENIIEKCIRFDNIVNPIYVYKNVYYYPDSGY